MSEKSSNIKKLLKSGKQSKSVNHAMPRLKDQNLINDIENLTKDKIFRADDNDVSQLRDLLLETRNKLNPYKVKVEGCDEGRLIFSFINMQKDYMTKLIATSFLAFMRRAVNEWGVPDSPVSVPVIDVVDYLRDPSIIDPAVPLDGTKLSQETIDAYDLNKKLMMKRVVVAEFLEYFFGFDPDRHARPGYKPNFKDPERRPIMSASGELSVLLEKKRTEKDKKSTRDERNEAAALYEKYMEEKKLAESGKVLDKPCLRKITRTIKSKDGKPMTVERTIKCTETEYKLAQLKKDNPDDPNNLKVLESDNRVIPKGSPEWSDYFDRKNIARDQALHDVVRDLIPPADMFYRFNVYFEKHYEQLQEAVRDLYHEKPDFDASIMPYKIVRDTVNDKGEKVTAEENVKNFRHEHERDINFSINDVNFGNWSIIAPYKENRDRVNYFGQNMAVFEEMFKMKAAEKVLAKDMMDKSVARKRRTHQSVHGKNDPEFEKNYGSIGSQSLKQMGVDKVKEFDECPDDAIEVGVFRFSQGGRKIEVDKLYTQAEAPEFMLQKS
jgi:hypothetical protein